MVLIDRNIPLSRSPQEQDLRQLIHRQQWFHSKSPVFGKFSLIASFVRTVIPPQKACKPRSWEQWFFSIVPGKGLSSITSLARFVKNNYLLNPSPYSLEYVALLYKQHRPLETLGFHLKPPSMVNCGSHVPGGELLTLYASIPENNKST